MANKGKPFFIKLFLLVNEKEMREWEHHHFATANKLTDGGTKYQQLLTSQKEGHQTLGDS